MRLDVPLVHRGGGEFALDDDVGVGKPGRRVALLKFHVGSDVAGIVRDLAHGRRVDQIVVQQWSAVLHRGAHVDDGFQHLVVNVDQGQRRLSNVRIFGGDGGDRVPAIQRLVTGEEIVAQELEPVVVVAQILFAEGRKRQVGGGHHRAHPGEGFRFGRVDGLDTGVRVWASQDSGVQQAGQIEIRAVLCSARDLIHSIGAHRPFSNYVVFDFR